MKPKPHLDQCTQEEQIREKVLAVIGALILVISKIMELFKDNTTDETTTSSASVQ